MTSTILKEVLVTLDRLEVFPKENGIKPILLVDGHSSRFQLPFLEYINNVDCKWSTVLFFLIPSSVQR